MFLVEYWMLEGEGEQLIWPAGGIISVLTVNYIVKISTIGVPKSTIEGLARSRCVLCVRGCCLLAVFFSNPMFGKPQRIIPKSVNFDRLAPSRRDHPIVHLCVHPCELVARRSLPQQAIGLIQSDSKPGSTNVMIENIKQLGQNSAQRVA